MKTQYKYIFFRLSSQKYGAEVWECWDKKYVCVIAHIAWYPQWNKTCFMPQPYSTYSLEDINVISHFMEQLKL